MKASRIVDGAARPAAPLELVVAAGVIPSRVHQQRGRAMAHDIVTRVDRATPLNRLSGRPATLTAQLLPWPANKTAKDIGWLSRIGPRASDANLAFEALMAAQAAGASILPRGADAYAYLFVGGLLSDLAPAGIYLRENMRALADEGLETRRVPIDTEQSVLTNAKTIRRSIIQSARAGKKVVLVCHSKGGCDSVAALTLYPELRHHVRGLVTIQSPHGGSPVAADLKDAPIIGDAVMSVIAKLVGGDVAAGTDLSYDSRRAFLSAHAMPRGVPTICMSSTHDSPLSLVAAAQYYIRGRYGVGSDGLVVPADAALPGSRAVTLHGVDHLELTFPQGAKDPLGGPRYPQRALTRALVAMVLTSTCGADGVTRPRRRDGQSSRPVAATL